MESRANGQQVLPFYLVCDESGSMSGAPINAINQALPELHNEIGSNPVVADKTQFAIIGFSDDAQVLLPLSDLSQVAQLPVLQTYGMTSYASAFRLLKTTIDADVARLKAAGNRVYRPVVFFLTDGFPNHGEQWEQAYDALVDKSNPIRPHIVAFGIGSANDSVITAVATFRAFVSNGTMSPAQALQEFATALTKSILKSGQGSTAQGMTLQTPDAVPGFTSLAVDQL